MPAKLEELDGLGKGEGNLGFDEKDINVQCSYTGHDSPVNLRIPGYVFNNEGRVRERLLFTRLENGNYIEGSELGNGVYVSKSELFYCNRQCWCKMCED